MFSRLSHLHKNSPECLKIWQLPRAPGSSSSSPQPRSRPLRGAASNTQVTRSRGSCHHHALCYTQLVGNLHQQYRGNETWSSSNNPTHVRAAIPLGTPTHPCQPKPACPRYDAWTAGRKRREIPAGSLLSPVESPAMSEDVSVARVASRPIHDPWYRPSILQLRDCQHRALFGTGTASVPLLSPPRS